MDPISKEQKILEVRKRDGDLDNAIQQLQSALAHGERKKVDVPEPILQQTPPALNNAASS